MIADLEELENLEASEIHPRRINAKGVLLRQEGEEFIFPVADCTAKLSVRDYDFRESTLRWGQTVRSEDVSGELQSEPGESQSRESTDDAEARADFWSIQGDFIYRHHNEPRVQLYEPKEETFPIPRKNIDVTRSTYTDLDVMQEKGVDDYWNVDSNRSLSVAWKGFTKFTPWRQKPPKGHTWSGRRFTKVQTTTRPYQVWPKKYGQKKVKPLRIEKNKNGKTRNQNAIKLDDWGAFSLLTLVTKITKTQKNAWIKIRKTYGSDHAVQKESSN